MIITIIFLEWMNLKKYRLYHHEVKSTDIYLSTLISSLSPDSFKFKFYSLRLRSKYVFSQIRLNIYLNIT
jgi:hypothetical protein